jgi:hypothetical protein
VSLGQWFALCESIGIAARNYDTMEIFIMGGRIIEDAEVRSRQGIGEHPKLHFAGKTAAQIIAGFTQAEKLALRDRILGVREISK